MWQILSSKMHINKNAVKLFHRICIRRNRFTFYAIWQRYFRFISDSLARTRAVFQFNKMLNTPHHLYFLRTYFTSFIDLFVQMKEIWWIHVQMCTYWILSKYQIKLSYFHSTSTGILDKKSNSFVKSHTSYFFHTTCQRKNNLLKHTFIMLKIGRK